MITNKGNKDFADFLRERKPKPNGINRKKIGMEMIDDEKKHVAVNVTRNLNNNNNDDSVS